MAGAPGRKPLVALGLIALSAAVAVTVTVTVAAGAGVGISVRKTEPSPDPTSGLTVTVRAQLAESLPLLGVDRVQRELGLSGRGVGVLIVDDWTRGHGQAVTEIVRAVAPGARLRLCRLDFERATSWDLAACLRRAVQSWPDVRVVNMSFAAGDHAFAQPCGGLRDPLADEIRRLARRGVVFVAAAGNDGLRGALRYPACLPEVLSVGASYDFEGWVEFRTEQVQCVDRAEPDKLACYSNAAPFLDVVAPGTVLSTPSNPEFGGTSAAAPLVSGLVALLLEADPTLTLDRLRRRLRETADAAWDPPTGARHPRVNAWRAALATVSAGWGPGLQARRAFDANGNGRVDDAEFFKAIDAWVAGRLDDRLFFALIDLWVQGATSSANASASASVSAGTNAEALWITSIALFDAGGRLVWRHRWGAARPLGRALAALQQSARLPNGVYFYVARARAGTPQGGLRLAIVTGKVAWVR